MSKYEQIYHLFLQDLKNHQSNTEACLNFGDRFVCEMLRYFDWREQDAEYVILPQNRAVISAKGKRISILESNLTNLERVAYWQNGYCCFGVRLSLLFRENQPARVPEVMFVIPLYIQNNIQSSDQEQFMLKTDPSAEAIAPAEYDRFFDSIIERIRSALISGVQLGLDQGGIDQVGRDHAQTNRIDRQFGIMLFQSQPSP